MLYTISTLNELIALIFEILKSNNYNDTNQVIYLQKVSYEKSDKSLSKSDFYYRIRILNYNDNGSPGHDNSDLNQILPELIAYTPFQNDATVSSEEFVHWAKLVDNKYDDLDYNKA